MEPTRKPLILIVDDTPHNIQLLSNILYKNGYNINISTTGAHCLQSVSTHAPDLILLDIQMPEMDGFEVCKTLKSNPKTKDIPVIFLTAITEMEKIMKGFEIGAVDYITKPFNEGELLARVATHIELKYAKDKLVEMNVTKDKFFSIIAHDIKNPFAGLLIFCDLLQRSIAKNDLAEIEKFASNISIVSKDIFNLLENLLNWSKLQMGKFEVKKRNFNIHSLINESLTSVHQIAKNKEINIVTTGNEKAKAIFDYEMFKSIIRNLVTNAIKYSNEGGKVVVEITDLNEKYFKISVKDSGIGISKENIEKLFRIDVFYTTHGTNNETGTGLGLVLCKDFAKKNGAEIFVESEPGIGSIFSFTAEKVIDYT